MVGTEYGDDGRSLFIGKGDGMPWRSLTSYPFSGDSIRLNAPHESGIYALFNQATWVCVGGSRNMRPSCSRI